MSKRQTQEWSKSRPARNLVSMTFNWSPTVPSSSSSQSSAHLTANCSTLDSFSTMEHLNANAMWLSKGKRQWKRLYISENILKKICVLRKNRIIRNSAFFEHYTETDCWSTRWNIWSEHDRLGSNSTDEQYLCLGRRIAEYGTICRILEQ